MKTRQLGNTDLHVSEVSLGCWQFGGEFGPIDENAVNHILETALGRGVNFYDTADVYGGGRSETLLGKALPGPEPYIATKYGRGGETYPDRYSLDNLRDAVRRSQDRLRRDRIDLLQLHCIPTEVLARGEIFDWLRTVQQEGLIRYFGASVETVEEGLMCTKQDDLASLQIIFNLFRQKPLDELLPQAKDKGIGVIVRLPLASGMLTGKFSADTTFDESDHRNFNRDGQAFSVGETFAGIAFDKGLQLVEELEQLKPEGYSMSQLAMRWILDHDAVSTVIPGASSPAHVLSNTSCSELQALQPELHEQLRQFYKEKVAQHIRGVY